MTTTTTTTTPLTRRYPVDPDLPEFAGHYPGYPVFPGVFLLDFVDRTARAALAPGLTLDAYDRCRFIRPVYPGDVVTVQVNVDADGVRVRCRAAVSTDNGPVADVRLTYSGTVTS